MAVATATPTAVAIFFETEGCDALARIVENPREVASQPSVSKKIATAVGVAVATAIAKRLLERYVLPARAPAPQRRRGTSSAEGASARAQ